MCICRCVCIHSVLAVAAVRDGNTRHLPPGGALNTAVHAVNKYSDGNVGGFAGREPRLSIDVLFRRFRDIIPRDAIRGVLQTGLLTVNNVYFKCQVLYCAPLGSKHGCFCAPSVHL